MSKQCFRKEAGGQEIQCNSVFKREDTPEELEIQLKWERYCLDSHFT